MQRETRRIKEILERSNKETEKPQLCVSVGSLTREPQLPGLNERPMRAARKARTGERKELQKGIQRVGYKLEITSKLSTGKFVNTPIVLERAVK